MRVYSADRAANLGNVRPQHVYSLLEILHGSSFRSRSFIAARFADVATHFEETVLFLEDVGWVRSENGHLFPRDEITGSIVRASDAERSALLLETLLDASEAYGRLFARYLSQFERREGELVHHPTLDERLSNAEARDFLMALGAVTYRIDGDFYVLEQRFATWALWARNVMSPSAEQLRLGDERRLQLGRAAELAVVDWEKQRVGPTWQDRVRHVSEKNPAACFDIESVTVEEEQAEPRFIEVKAVAVDSLEFHWSGAEIEAAEILGPRYFLYLLPVVAPNRFDVSHMEIVSNAFDGVYRNPSKWSTTVADTICRKKERFDS